MLRVNSAPEHVTLDLKAAVQAGIATVFLPKVENADQIAAAEYLAPGVKLVAMLESPAAVLDAPAIVAKVFSALEKESRPMQGRA